MNATRLRLWSRSLLVALIASASATLLAQDANQGFRFRSAVELVNVTATVTDERGRFVSGLRREDFAIREDGQPQRVTHFSSERVPVSLGIVLDVSGSMSGEKYVAAERALNRFLYDLLAPEDEIFIVAFSDQPDLVSDWTTDRRQLSNALARIRPRGGTALYDAVAEAVPMAQSGRHKKKAVVVVSDGNDTDSRTDGASLQALIRETEVLVYAIGIDGAGESRSSSTWPTQPRIQLPFPFPGGGTWGRPRPRMPPGGSSSDRVNAAVLREITDDSGGRTEIIRGTYDLDPATAGIAHELSQQYSLGYVPLRSKDGRWHTIDVAVQGGRHHVRARRGYLAQ